MRKINIPLLVANILTGLAFIVHTVAGDMEISTVKPEINIADFTEKQQIWTMIRCGWHWISFDLLFATIALTLVNFSNYFDNKKTILQLLSLYFFGYAIVWLLVISISDSFSNNYINLGQWMLLLSISGFIYYGIKKQKS